MSLLDVAAGVAVLAGALIQSAVGFGFALVCAPLLFAALGAREAVGLENGLALLVNATTLLTEGRRPDPLRRTVVVVLAWSVPGMLAGAVILESVDSRLLQVALTVMVFAALALRLHPARHDGPAPGWATPTTGVVTGALTTTIATAGPPLVLLLTGRGHPPQRVRDSLAVVVMAQSVIGIAALAVTGSGTAPQLVWIAALVPLTVAGQLVGRRLFGRLAARGYERMLTAVLVLSATIGLVAALT
jgi:uncharacterized membrane protein YfcA